MWINGPFLNIIWQGIIFRYKIIGVTGAVLFMGQELYDWFAVDVFWVASTDWWLIPEAQDLEYLWHVPKGK